MRDLRENLRPKRTNRRKKVKVWLNSSEEGVISAFWDLSGEIEPFPRNLERYVALALPLTIIKLPRLRITDVQDWLARRGAAIGFACRDRQLRGCLVAYRGEGIIFTDGADAQAEIRFTIAHELAHFLVDYIYPRSLALSTFGISVREVLDGLRAPTISERLQAVFASRPLALHIDLMERTSGGDSSSSVHAIEARADRVGLALLAPPQAVLSGLAHLAKSFAERHEAVTSELCNGYGLPLWLAREYARQLLHEMGRGPSWTEAIKRI